MNAVANIDIDFLDISGDLGMKFHLLIGKEFTSDRECVGERRAPDLYDRGAGRRIGGYRKRTFAGMAAASSTDKTGRNQAQGRVLNRHQRRSLRHFRSHPYLVLQAWFTNLLFRTSRALSQKIYKRRCPYSEFTSPTMVPPKN